MFYTVSKADYLSNLLYIYDISLAKFHALLSYWQISELIRLTVIQHILCLGPVYHCPHISENILLSENCSRVSITDNHFYVENCWDLSRLFIIYSATTDFALVHLGSAQENSCCSTVGKFDCSCNVYFVQWELVGSE